MGTVTLGTPTPTRRAAPTVRENCVLSFFQFANNRNPIQAAGTPSTGRASRRGRATTIGSRQRRVTTEALVLFSPGPCIAHLVHLMLESAAGEKKVVGDVYALEYIAQVPTTFNKITSGLLKWLTMPVQLHRGVKPPKKAWATWRTY